MSWNTVNCIEQPKDRRIFKVLFLTLSKFHYWVLETITRRFKQLGQVEWLALFARQHFLTSVCSTHFSSREHFLLVLRCSTHKGRQGHPAVIYYWSLKSLNVFPFFLWWRIGYGKYDDRIQYDGILCDGTFWWGEEMCIRTSLWGSAFSHHLSFSLMRAFLLAVLVLDLMLQGVLDRKLNILRVESGMNRKANKVDIEEVHLSTLRFEGYPPGTCLVLWCGCFRLVNPIYGSCTVESVPQELGTFVTMQWPSLSYAQWQWPAVMLRFCFCHSFHREQWNRRFRTEFLQKFLPIFPSFSFVQCRMARRETMCCACGWTSRSQPIHLIICGWHLENPKAQWAALRGFMRAGQTPLNPLVVIIVWEGVLCQVLCVPSCSFYFPFCCHL